MGNWRLEAFKMSIYMSFPVVVFWWFNQPQFFEEWTIKKRRELYPPTNPDDEVSLKNTVMFLEKRKQANLEKQYIINK